MTPPNIQNECFSERSHFMFCVITHLLTLVLSKYESFPCQKLLINCSSQIRICLKKKCLTRINQQTGQVLSEQCDKRNVPNTPGFVC